LGPATGLTSGLAAVYPSAMAIERIKVQRYAIAVRGLPRELDGLRILHVSDTHYGPFIGRAHVAHAARVAEAEAVDLVCFTGDYVHRTSRAIEGGVALLARFHGRLGAVAVLGNHDHWEGVARCREAFARIGVPLIDNDRRFLTPDGLARHTPVGPAICLGGVGDLAEDETRFDFATADAPPHMPRIILAHNPDSAERAPPDLRIDLMLSGHTHGGQVAFPGIGAPLVPSRYGRRYAGGLCQGPHFPVIVSRGVGLALLPFRFRVPPEIGVITLRRIEDDAPTGGGA